MLAVGADAAHDRGRVDHVVGSSVGDRRPHARWVREVVIRGPNDDRCRPSLLERPNDTAAEEASAPGDQDA